MQLQIILMVRWLTGRTAPLSAPHWAQLTWQRHRSLKRNALHQHVTHRHPHHLFSIIPCVFHDRGAKETQNVARGGEEEEERVWASKRLDGSRCVRKPGAFLTFSPVTLVQFDVKWRHDLAVLLTWIFCVYNIPTPGSSLFLKLANTRLTSRLLVSFRLNSCSHCQRLTAIISCCTCDSSR